MLTKWLERWRQRERPVINNRRPAKGKCPVCRVPSYTWCTRDCSLHDPMDYR